MRVALAAMMHESNTFNPTRTPLAAFRPVQGRGVLRHPQWSKDSSVAGMVRALEARDAELAPTFFARAVPSGVVERRAYENMRSAIVDGVAGADPDAVCLALHGSMYVEDEPDPEGDLLQHLRDAVGERPIAAALDLHATPTDRLLETADIITTYRTAPHLDVVETGERTAALLSEVVAGDLEPVTEWFYLPMLLSGEESETGAQPMRELMEQLEVADRRDGLRASSFFLGFPWADSPHGGVGVASLGEAGHRSEVRRTARELAAAFWARRGDFGFSAEAEPLEAALDRALAAEETVLVSDAGDNPTAGASGDLCIVLEALLARNAENAVVAAVIDVAACQGCRDAGVGERFLLSLGRREAEPGAEPLVREVEVLYLGRAGGVPCAVVAMDGVTVVIAGGRTGASRPELLQDLRLDPRRFAVVVVKCGYVHPDFLELCPQHILALTPGHTDLNFGGLEYTRLPRPIHPLDDGVDWTPAERGSGAPCGNGAKP